MFHSGRSDESVHSVMSLRSARYNQRPAPVNCPWSCAYLKFPYDCQLSSVVGHQTVVAMTTAGATTVDVHSVSRRH